MLERLQGVTGSFNLVLSLVYSSKRLEGIKSAVWKVALRYSTLKFVNSPDHAHKRRVNNADKLNPNAPFPPLLPLNWLADAAVDVPSTVYTRESKSPVSLSSRPQLARDLLAQQRANTTAVANNILLNCWQFESLFHLGKVSNPRSEVVSVISSLSLSYYELNSVTGFVGVSNCCHNLVDVTKAMLASGYQKSFISPASRRSTRA
ncbi:hypothetical protein JCM6882_006219 [Rhodosporidiobolus microsporus]